MLINLYKANVANAPKNEQTAASKCRQTSPASAEGYEPSSIAAIATKGAAAAVKEPKNLRNDEMMPVANEQQKQQQATAATPENKGATEQASFHQATENENANIRKATNANVDNNLCSFSAGEMPSMNAIPTSVVVGPNGEPFDIKPVIHPTTGRVMSMLANAGLDVGSSVIKPVPTLTDVAMPSLAPLSSALERANALSSQNSGTPAGVIPTGCDVLPPAAVLAAALLRDGYNNFQQQLRTQELMQMSGQVDANSGNVGDNSVANTFSTKIFENFFRQRHLKSEGSTDNTANEMDTADGDDEDDSRYNGFDDIHLIESSKPNYNSSSMPGLYQQGVASSSSPHLTASNTDCVSNDSQKFIFTPHSQAFRHIEYTFGVENGSNSLSMVSGQESGNNENGNESSEPIYECRHCGKKYRWKSTLRRHENVECGGKEPSHQCPYCPYKSKQRGNLGVHVRKHHSDLPQLASKRRSKYTNKLKSGNINANASDDSSSKLVIDCSK